MTGRKTCANCGAVLFEPWFDWERRGYDCNYCHALTGREGELLAGPPASGEPTKSRSFDPRGLVLIGAVIVAVIVIYLAQNL
jgi:hypothetical protein